MSLGGGGGREDELVPFAVARYDDSYSKGYAILLRLTATVVDRYCFGEYTSPRTKLHGFSGELGQRRCKSWNNAFNTGLSAMRYLKTLPRFANSQTTSKPSSCVGKRRISCTFRKVSSIAVRRSHRENFMSSTSGIAAIFSSNRATFLVGSPNPVMSAAARFLASELVICLLQSGWWQVAKS
jgi:hypothetical protein